MFLLTAPLSLLLSAPAAAGYGDVVDGYPSWSERELHLYTNAARVAPEAFEADYQRGGCSTADFSADELTPKAPVYYSPPLNDAARYHSQDMLDSGIFSHDSSDGTSFGSRLAEFYPESGYVGENIAYGYPDSWAVMMEGWMCSTSGHRANIMNGDWQELGTGVVSTYYTQDFGGGAADSDGGIRMGVHTPERPAAGDQATFYADWDGPELAVLSLVLSGQVHALSLEWGEVDRGVYRVDAEAPEGCAEYYFVYEDGGGQGVFPEDGSYTMGAGCTADWVSRDETLSPWGDGGAGGGLDTGSGAGIDDISIKSCAAAPSTPGGLGLLGLALLGLTTRRRRA